MGPPIDEMALSQQAMGLLPPDDQGFKAYSPFLLMGIAVHPAEQILSPAQMEDNEFATELRRESLYGPVPIFDRAKGTNAKASKGVLIVSQPNGAEIRLEASANITLKIPLRIAPPRQGRPSPIYEEDAALMLKNMMSFSSYILDRIDAPRRLTHIAIALKMFGTDMMIWRRKGDTQPSFAHAVVPPPQRDAILPAPAVSPRAAFAGRAGEMAQAFISLLKAQALWEELP